MDQGAKGKIRGEQAEQGVRQWFRNCEQKSSQRRKQKLERIRKRKKWGAVKRASSRADGAYPHRDFLCFFARSLAVLGSWPLVACQGQSTELDITTVGCM
jgi:hypothetical protein